MTDELDEILSDLEHHFAVPSITATEAHQIAKREIERYVLKARIEELKRPELTSERISYLYRIKRIAELKEKLGE